MSWLFTSERLRWHKILLWLAGISACVCVCVCVCVCLHPNDADMSYVNPKIFNKIHSQFSKIWGKVAKMWKQQSHESPEEHETAVLFLTSKWPANLLELSRLHRGL